MSFEPLFPPSEPGADFQPCFPAPSPGGLFTPLWSADLASLTPRQTAQEALAEAHRVAEEIIAQARQQAAVEAESEIARAVEAVRQEHVAAFAEASAGLLRELREQGEAHVAALSRDAAELVVDIARRVLHERFTEDEQAIVPVVRTALQAVADGDRVQVIIAPQHQAALQEAYRELAGVLKQDARLEIVVSDMAAPFGCVARAEGHSVDARLESRLEALQQAVAQTLVSSEAA
jgi:flagellar biosynthesis/type III secretory pathway protein FliH